MRNELWYALLQSGLTEAQRESLTFAAAKSGSPYLEAQEEAAAAAEEGKPVPVNPAPRLSGLFSLLTENSGFGNSEEGKLLFHTFMELVLRIDCYMGYDRHSCIRELLLEEIKRECFGKELTEALLGLSEQLLNRTLEYLAAMYETGNGIYYFVLEMKALFPGCVLFWHSAFERMLYIFIGGKKTSLGEERLRTAVRLFLPMDCDYRVSWEHPYALLDVEQMYAAGNRLV